MKGRAVVRLASHEAERRGARQDLAVVTVNHGGAGSVIEVVDDAKDIARI